MNDFSELESQLRKLRPVQPSPDLKVRIERALGEQATSAPTAAVLPRERRFHLNWVSLGLGLAATAALAMFAFVRLQNSGPTKPSIASRAIVPAAPTAFSPQFVPAGLTQVVYHTRDEGLHFPTSAERPMRRIRSHTRETLQWRNPQTGASLRISYPKENVSLTPVSGQ